MKFYILILLLTAHTAGYSQLAAKVVFNVSCYEKQSSLKQEIKSIVEIRNDSKEPLAFTNQFSVGPLRDSTYEVGYEVLFISGDDTINMLDVVILTTWPSYYSKREQTLPGFESLFFPVYIPGSLFTREGTYIFRFTLAKKFFSKSLSSDLITPWQKLEVR